VALNTIVPWAIFRKTLESMRNGGRDPRKGGRSPLAARRLHSRSGSFDGDLRRSRI